MGYQTVFDLSQTWTQKGFDGGVEIIDEIKAISGVLSVKKMPCYQHPSGGMEETYHWKVYYLPSPSIFKKIQKVIEYYSLIGKRHISYNNDLSVERFKTGGHFYVQIVASDTPKNRGVLERARDIWKVCGWQHISSNETCGWISARANRNRN